MKLKQRIRRILLIETLDWEVILTWAVILAFGVWADITIYKLLFG